MAFTAVPPSQNLLAGYNEAGPDGAPAQIQAEAKAAATAKATTTAKKVTATKTTTAPAPITPKATTTTSTTAIPVTTLPADVSSESLHGVGESTPPATPITYDQVMIQAGLPSSTPAHSFDPVFGGILPVIFVIALIWSFLKYTAYSIRKNPPHGGYAKKRKQVHPGVMKPRVFK